MKNIIVLNKKDNYFLAGKFFLVKKGKLISREILENGRVISNEDFLKNGDIIGNFFCFLTNETMTIPEFEIEIEALEDNTVLEEFDLTSEDIFKNDLLEKLINQLIKRNIIKFFYQLYDTKGYILAVLKLYANDNNSILKSDINYENFNVSRSQFYVIFSKLKKEKFLKEKNGIIFLDVEKINNYLEKSYTV